MNRRQFLFVSAVAPFARVRATDVVRSLNSNGITVSVSASGVYQVGVDALGWVFRGHTGNTPDGISVSQGSDTIGDYSAINLSYAPARSSEIRLYANRPVVLFTTTYGVDGPNTDPFPTFDDYPRSLFRFAYNGLWDRAYGWLAPRGPWLLFDGQANSAIMSPASNFMTTIGRENSDGTISMSLDPQIPSLPGGYTQCTMLAFGGGINSTFDTWGRALTDWTGKRRPANDSISLLQKLSYWTDALSAYYYYGAGDPTKYVPLLLNVRRQYEQLGVPIGSMELDSWYYPKGQPPSWSAGGAGLDSFQADTSLFPDGLGAFQNRLGVPLAAHTRWIDPNSDLRTRYKVSGNVAVDPRYWQDYATYMANNGVEVLEQDWLSGPAITDNNLTDPYAFLDNMAAAMKAQGRSILYCMPVPRHFLQSAKYDNVVAIRVSPDGLRRDRWDALLLNSRLASAVGLWPFADAVQSRSVKDVLLGTLTAGPLGVGDAIDAIDAGNLGQAIRPDGVIVKPDAPMVPMDSVFLADAQKQVAPMSAFTYTDHTGSRALYVFAYERTLGATSTLTFSPAALGITGHYYIYDYFNKTGYLMAGNDVFTSVVDSSGTYYIVVPVGHSGIALLGDAGKFVSRGKKRITALSDDGVLHVEIAFAPAERFIVLQGHAPRGFSMQALHGSATHLRTPSPDLFHVAVAPGPDGVAVVEFHPLER